MPIVPVYDRNVTLNGAPRAVTQSFMDPTQMFQTHRPNFEKVSDEFMKLQDKIDASRVLEAKNDALNYISEVTYGEQGYTKLQGKNALEADEQKRGLSQRVTEGFDEHMDTFIRENGYTQRQIAMIRNETAPLRIQLQNGVRMHVLKEKNTYDQQNVKACLTNGLNSASLSFANPGAFRDGIENAEKTLKDAKGIFGWSDEVYSQQLKAFKSEYYSNGIAGALASMGKDVQGGYATAQRLFNAHSKDMSAEAILKFQGLLEKAQITAATENLTKTFDDFMSLTTSAEATSMGVVVNGKTPLATTNRALAYSAATEANSNKKNANGHLATNAFGGIGESGVRVDQAKEVLGKDFDEAKFRTDAAYNYEVGMKVYEQCVKENPTDLVSAIASYRLGKDVVETAKKAAEGTEDPWTKYLSESEEKEVSSIVKKVGEHRDGVLYDKSGNKVDALSAGYARMSIQQMSREQIEKFVDAQVGDLVKSNYLLREKLVDALFNRQEQRVNDLSKDYTNRVGKCIAAINNGEQLPLEVFNSLPLVAQREIETLQTRRSRGYGEPDVKKLNYYLAHPEAYPTDEETYQAFVRPFFGNKATDMDNRRASYFQSKMDRQQYEEAVNNALKNGQILPAYMPTTDQIMAAYKDATKETLDLKSARDRGMLVRLSEFLGSSAQAMAKVNKKGDPVALDRSEMAIKISDYLHGIRSEGLPPLNVVKDDLSDEAKLVLRQLTLMYGTSKYGNYAYDPLHEEFVLSRLTLGLPIDFGIDLNKLRLSEPILNECIADERKQTGETNPQKMNPYKLIGRYLQKSGEKPVKSNGRIDETPSVTE